MIIKGSCDYLSWHSVTDYRDALSATTVVYLSGAGHDIIQDRPVDVTDSVGAFLTGTPLPLSLSLSPYTELTAPPDYQGPP